MPGILLAIAFGIGAPAATAATIEQLAVHRHGAGYRVAARVSLGVSQPAAFDAATRFEALPRYAPAIISTRRSDDHRIASRIRICVLQLCRTIRQVVRYHETAPSLLRMHVVPGAGDFKSGWLRWRFVAISPGHTALHFRAQLVPAFWVPPMIGTWAVRRALHGEIQSTAQAIETLAQRTKQTRRAP